ncbi:MAG: dephospho-CoA kinase [bacterium]|nr:dephospho-CoA kinase [bacterium]
MLKIAISGNIASGKSVVENFIRGKGYKVFDTDIIAHEKIDEFSLQIINTFKDCDILSDDKIDRKKLGKIVFNNPDKLKMLENILDPLVRDEIEKIFNQNAKEDAIFISVPLLFESGFDKMFDKILFVSAKENIRLARLIKRNNLTNEEAQVRIDAQLGEIHKLDKCDFIVNNNGSIKELEIELEKMLSNIC